MVCGASRRPGHSGPCACPHNGPQACRASCTAARLPHVVSDKIAVQTVVRQYLLFVAGWTRAARWGFDGGVFSVAVSPACCQCGSGGCCCHVRHLTNSCSALLPGLPRPILRGRHATLCDRQTARVLILLVTGRDEAPDPFSPRGSALAARVRGQASRPTVRVDASTRAAVQQASL